MERTLLRISKWDFWNPVRKESCSAILFLQSEDGIHFDRINQTPILGPTGRGWKASHVYACDVKYSETEKIFILYFNARNKAHWTQGKEAIGLFVGKVEESKTSGTKSTKQIKKQKPTAKKKISKPKLKVKKSKRK